jgi:prepilin-type N-terminal cleavage/methylation domain-containing protein
LIAGKPNPANNPMIEITTSNSTNVNELLFVFGNLRDKVMFITMTTPTLPPFHQKNPAKKNFAKNLRLQSRIQNQESKIFNSPSSLNSFIPLRTTAAFTLIELLAVITVIGILAGLTLGAAGAVRRHGATSTAKAEVAALQAACDRYYADYNLYPSNTSAAPSAVNPTNYTAAGQVLFTNLLGSATLTAVPTRKRYFEPKPAMVFTNTSPTILTNYFIDPWGYAYGYNSDGTNAPLIWSTAGQTTAGGTNKWITSWPKM